MPRSAVAVVSPMAVSDEELRVLKQTLNADLSDTELRLFSMVAARSGLDPFAKQIFAVKRQGKVTFQTSQEGYLSIAARTGEYDGCDEPEYGPLQGTPIHPEWATVRVYRKGMSKGVAATAYWSEYYPGEAQGHMWKKMPRVMLAKVARVAALRLAFPYIYADLYSEDEMAQADRPAVRLVRDTEGRSADPSTGEIVTRSTTVIPDLDDAALDELTSDADFSDIAAIVDAVDPIEDDYVSCGIHQTAWAGEPGDLWHKTDEGRYCRHPENVRKQR